MSFSSPLFRYEDEINKRTECENEFVLIKKVRGRFFTHFSFMNATFNLNDD